MASQSASTFSGGVAHQVFEAAKVVQSHEEEPVIYLAAGEFAMLPSPLDSFPLGIPVSGNSLGVLGKDGRDGKVVQGRPVGQGVLCNCSDDPVDRALSLTAPRIDDVADTLFGKKYVIFEIYLTPLKAGKEHRMTGHYIFQLPASVDQACG
ncbi:MAG: hypothetical protein SVV80_11800 [Planctomycetota bacterium]|nr:hypothetical protein [Planctomycetota bacterium]